MALDLDGPWPSHVFLTMRRPGEILLIACYELGHQPLAVAWPAAALERAGYAPTMLDVSVDGFDPELARAARLVAISVPMHTALRLGVKVAERVRDVNPSCHVAFYGLYATLNAEYLLAHGADSVMSGEVEAPLLDLVRRLEAGAPLTPALAPHLARVAFEVPSRAALPTLERYAHLERDGKLGLAGYVEASRGCKHQCRHCPIPPVYGGRFFVVPLELVLADVRQLVAAGGATGIGLRPTWVAFTPWTTLADYRAMLDFVETEDLIHHVDPVQYAVRLLVPPGSLLLKSDALRPHLGPLVEDAFHYGWTHPDPRMDELHAKVTALVADAAAQREGAEVTFARLRELRDDAGGGGRASEARRAPVRSQSEWGSER